MKQSVKRVTLTGAWQTITFTDKATHYFVKNYTEGDIFVSFAANDSEDESFKITAGIGEELAISFDAIRGRYAVNTIYVKGTGEVEIQQLDQVY